MSNNIPENLVFPESVAKELKKQFQESLGMRKLVEDEYGQKNTDPEIAELRLAAATSLYQVVHFILILQPDWRPSKEQSVGGSVIDWILHLIDKNRELQRQVKALERQVRDLKHSLSMKDMDRFT